MRGSICAWFELASATSASVADICLCTHDLGDEGGHAHAHKMNESEHHPKLKVQATLGAPVFVAGGDVYGKVEIESRADTELGLRSLFVELIAVERTFSLLVNIWGLMRFSGIF